MGQLKLHWGVALLALHLFACSKSDTSLRSQGLVIQSGHPIETTNSDHAQILYNTAYAFCSDLSACPEAIGMIAFIKKGNVGICTGFLVSPNEILTASACTQGQIKFLLPESKSSAAESLEIKRVTARLGEVTLLELTSASTRTPISLNRKGVLDLTPLKLYSFASQSDQSLIGAMKSSDCLSVMNSQVAPHYLEPLSDLISVAKCNADRGVAGAPLLDSDGSLRAVFITTASSTLSLAKNVACLGDSSLGTENPDCVKPRENIPDGFDHSRDLAMMEVQKQFDSWASTKQKIAPVRFTLGLGGQGGFAPIPQCFTSKEIDSDTYAVSSPIWSLIQRFDAWERPYFQVVSSIENYGTTLNFSLDTLKSTGSTPLMYKTGVISDAIPNFTYCTDPKN
jgi:hypothetical protein